MPLTFAFIFPSASGHMNPSLAVARPLVELGHQVHYMSTEVMRPAIEGTGAAFHSVGNELTEFMPDPHMNVMEVIPRLFKAHGLAVDYRNMDYLRSTVLELKLPGMLRFLERIGADAVIFCPVINRDAAVAAKVLGIPSVSLNTIAGPGAFRTCFDAIHEEMHRDAEEFVRSVNAFEPELAAARRVNERYGLDLKPGIELPLGKCDALTFASLNLVTTSDDLQDPMPLELLHAYEAAGTRFVGVGPLLDREGSRRAGTHRHAADGAGGAAESGQALSDAELVAQVLAARQAGRQVVLVSMGTVITGDVASYGWEGRRVGADGQPRGLTGKQLCRAAWGGAFDAFGAAHTGEGPLLVASLGPQPDPLGPDLIAPPNALCAPMLPQVDLLKAGIDVFLTHGGQNSFTEALTYATPVVVCPGAGDQVVNASKAVALGVGLKVARPDPDAGLEAEAVARYRIEVCEALREVLGSSNFTAAARGCSERLRAAGGVPRAVELILGAAATGRPGTDKTQQRGVAAGVSGASLAGRAGA